MIKISQTTAVNPKHVIAVMFDSTTLKTKVVFHGMVSVVSDMTFDETVDLFSKEKELE